MTASDTPITAKDLPIYAKQLAAKANACCFRSDGYEEDIEVAILIALKLAYQAGHGAAMKSM